MSQKPDGKSAKTERVTFTRGAAERIADAVREVEAGDRDGMPWRVSPRLAGSGSPKLFRICTFTGSWTKNTAKVVTFKYQTSTPNTATATNLFATVANTATNTVNCAIARDGTAWFLIAAEC